MTSMKTRTYLWVIAAAAWASSLAMADDGFKAPELKGAADWISIGVAALAVLGIAAAAFKNARRTHLD